MIKTGIVLNISNKKVGIMTSGGEFVYIKTNKALPKVGEILTGKSCSKNLSLYKFALTAASIMFIFVSIFGTYTYYTPVTTIALGTKTSVCLEANRWNRIISSKALNSDGLLILDSIKLKYKAIDDGLELIVKQAKTENFINDKEIISVDIKSNKNSSIDISNFKNIIDSNNLIIKINASSNKNIDITVNNKKINIMKLNNDYHKKLVSTKISNTKSSIGQKSSVDISTKILEDKLPNDDEKVMKSTKTIISKNEKSINSNFNNRSSTIKNPYTSTRIKKNIQGQENKSIENVKVPYYNNKNLKRNR